MKYNSYKLKFRKQIAILLSSIVLAGILVPVTFADEISKNEEPNPPIQVIGIYPESKYNHQWFNEETLSHDIWDLNTRNRLFLKVSFDTKGDNLTFDSLTGLTKLRDFTTVYSDSSNVSMVDIEFLNEIDNMDSGAKNDFIDRYIFRKDNANKRAYLYIPIKPLMSHMTYSATLGQGIVYTDKGVGNDSLTWSFNTMATPSLAEKDVLLQSVIEDYDVNEPIIITGKFFYSPTVEVYFNNVRAYSVRLREDHEGEEYLEVYLPRGRNKLDPGLYDITVENSYNHSKWLYGTLSVVPESDYRTPVEDNSFGAITNYGIVSGARRIEAIRLDHAEPVKDQILRKQLTEYNLRSPLVEVEGRGYSVYTFALEIPIEQGLYENYKVLRYDELSRSWTEERNYYINKIDQRAIITSFESGIFVVVESKY